MQVEELAAYRARRARRAGHQSTHSTASLPDAARLSIQPACTTERALASAKHRVA